MWQIEKGGNVSYRPMIPEVNTRTGEIYSPEQMRKMELNAKNSAYDFVNRQLKGQSFVWVEVGTGDPDAETTQRQIKRGTTKGTFKVTAMQPSTTYPVTVTQGTPKSPTDIGKGKGAPTLQTNVGSDTNLKNVENARADMQRSKIESDNKKRIEKEKAEKKAINKGKPAPESLSFEDIDRKFKGTTKSGEAKKYTPAKPSTEIEVKKAIDSLDSNIEKLKKIIDKQPVNSRTEETARSLKRVEYMKLIKEAEYKDLMSRRSAGTIETEGKVRPNRLPVGTSVKPPSIEKLKKEAGYLDRRLDKIDAAIKENTDKLKEIKKYEYGKAAPREKLVKVIDSHRQDKKFATEALKVILLILSRGKAK